MTAIDRLSDDPGMSTAQSAADPLVELFADSPRHFAGSPLYARLGQVVAADDRLLAIARHARSGQLPSNLLLASVHYLLLRDPAQELAAWYPSCGAGTAAGDPGPAFTAFCLRRREEIVALMRRRLVQTNVVKRSAVLRLGMAAVASMTDEPVTLIEVGSSAGVHLRFDDYRYAIAGRTWGRASSRVVVSAEWRGEGPPPDLGPLPVIADRAGIDLNPIDARDPDERLWLRALIWPENTAQATLQDEALRAVAANPPRTYAGDAVELLPEVVAGVPRGTPVVIFHSATRLHVPAERREAFDAAIAGAGREHDLFHLSFEASRDLGTQGFALELRRGGEPGRRLAIGHGHAEWISDSGEARPDVS
ncbi:hypothetical protein Airi01_009570 [Actinoallomurus iriomotensis]|uniref:DUF2332 domain-containing protein n=2 Tax=Thermomonosporaceae TaxID=2012 RepID=A0A9W6RDJ1_9ACTN|nr:hypothetical protein Airi01_009570 [Actinoallomurus iriomotensis]